MRTTFQTGDGRLDHLRAAPIAPSSILDGQPVARSRCLLQADDERFSMTLWDCTAGRFHWAYGCDEMVHVVEGEVIVEDEQGRRRTLRAGDVALFQAGTRAVWEVPEYVRKVATHRVRRSPLSVRILRRLRRAIGRPSRPAEGLPG